MLMRKAQKGRGWIGWVLMVLPALLLLVAPTMVTGGPKNPASPGIPGPTSPPNLPGMPAPTPLFTFKVPITLNNVHKNVDKAFVECAVGVELLSIPGVHGVSSTEIKPLIGGNYTGPPITVVITQMESGDPAKVDWWRCRLFFEVDGQLVPADQKTQGIDQVVNMAKPNPQPVVLTTGKF